MSEQRTFTDAFIRGLKPARKPYKRAEKAPKGEGRLTVRVLPNGVKEFFYRYRVNGDDKTLSLGRFDPQGRTGVTLAKVRDDLTVKRSIQRETGDVKAHEQAEDRRKEVEKRKGTLGDLLAAYVKSLRDSGKWSADQVEGIFRRNVRKPFPALVDTKANEIEPGDIQRILARMVRADIGRQVNITRAYMRAAFAFGGKADHDPRTVAADGVLFGLKGNPVTLVPTIREYEKVGERTLAEDELREYWKALEGLPIVQGAALRLNLALACQRPSQLLRATWQDFDFEQNTLLLRDSKGRGGSRDHLLALTPFALKQLKPLREMNAAALSPFTADGKRIMVLTTLSVAVRDVSAKLKKEQKIPPFQLRDVRRTCETMLQKLGVDKEVRAHLLSHGRSQGVQGKHYERYDFLPEKRAALERWARHLQTVIEGKKKAKVVELRRA
jgi:integrase